VDKLEAEIERKKIDEILRKYEPQDRFNLDETALFFRLGPNKTLATTKQKLEGLKLSKERMTVAVVVNASGDEYIKPIVISTARKHHCFGRFDPNSIVSYFFNKTAWMTIAIFQAWLIDFNKYISKKKRNVILLVDNAGGHNLTEKWMNDNLTCVKVYYLPPNTTSVLQPYDAGIIRSFKAKYRKRVVKHLLLTIEMQDSYDLPDQK
jgi:hypothetical protein